MPVTFEVAHTREQGVDFLVVAMKRKVLTDPGAQRGIQALMAREYGPIPVVFATKASSGRVEYRGRRDIVRFLSGVFLEQLPWRRVTFRQAA